MEEQEKKRTRKERSPRAKRCGGGKGIRGKYYARLNPSVNKKPDAKLLHKVSWYFDNEKLNARPTYGILSLHTFANYLTARASKVYGKHDDLDRIVYKFLTEVNAVMRNALCAQARQKKFAKDKVAWLRHANTRLAALAEETYDAVNEYQTDLMRCPICRGNKKFTPEDVEILHDVLYRCSRNGIIPRTSRLYVTVEHIDTAPLTPTTVL